jgi:uracil-DNA glycosylase
VLLLNTVLTVEEGNPGSHAGKGWEQFTDRVLAELAVRKEGIVFLLWGSHAQKKAATLDTRRHHVLTAAHPSPLAASRGFFGCRHFSKTNDLLERGGKLPIRWGVSG